VRAGLVWLSGLLLATVGCSAESQSGSGPLLWQSCLDGLECATLEVPSDYAAKGAGSQHIAVARGRASEPRRRLGALLLNFGGPGAETVGGLSGFRAFLDGLAPELVAQFDLVGFDPRGIGRSRPALTFLDAATIEAFRALDPTPDDDDERAAHDAVADEMRAGAERLDATFMRHVDTESVARDMDRLRAALGEPVINYFGGSYGTLLGAVYATLFPERVRAFVLDSAVMPAFDRQELLQGQAAAYEQAFQGFLTRCADSRDCALSALGDAAAIEAAVRAFVEAADEEPLRVDTRLVHGSDLSIALGMMLEVGAGSGSDELLAGLLAGDVQPFLSGADAWYGRGDDGSYDDDIVDANLAIGALDAPYPEGFHRAEFDAFVEREVVPRSPLFGPMLAEVERTFVDWPFLRPGPLPKIHAPSARPLLVLAGSGDPATPARWSAALRDALANGSALVTHDDAVHGQLFRSQCVRDLAVPFLLDPSEIPADTTCDRDPEE